MQSDMEDLFKVTCLRWKLQVQKEKESCRHENAHADVEFLGKLSHPNLVKLLGYCHEDNHFLLIYEFMKKGSLENHLFASHLYVNSDVYWFGVVLLEIITGLRVVDTKRPPKEVNLAFLAKPCLIDGRKIQKIMDPKLCNQYPLEKAIEVAGLAKRCLELDSRNRPSMDQVLKTLKNVITIEVLRGNN
ncbi:hypothetical protein EZV62_004242 [Acer yangbiense]|uniref:Protein kinase domain-containing protein n=1 Tax=Acer yangbiense TaxID=1000413 RepID=A0A5C7IIV7_9ROSI|nr:hypothetical protein EZV62_004242 [Acer yangbiense]